MLQMQCPNNGDNFYPRPPRGGRPAKAGVNFLSKIFLSTPSARRATGTECIFAVCVGISIHALREEGDTPLWLSQQARSHFYPRPPRGGRPRYPGVMRKFHYFYPRPPRGGRPALISFSLAFTLFLSTPSARRATWPLWALRSVSRFLSTPSARRATAKTETKSLFSNKLYNILHEFRRALIYNGSKNYPNHAK